jgi:hypothetical protein
VVGTTSFPVALSRSPTLIGICRGPVSDLDSWVRVSLNLLEASS